MESYYAESQSNPALSQIPAFPSLPEIIKEGKGRIIESQGREGKAKRRPFTVTPFREGPFCVTGGLPCKGKASPDRDKGMNSKRKHDEWQEGNGRE